MKEKKLKAEIFSIPVDEMIPQSKGAEEELTRALTKELMKAIDDEMMEKGAKCLRCGIEWAAGKLMEMHGKLFFCTDCEATLCGHQVWKRSKTEEWFHGRFVRQPSGKMAAGGCGPAKEIVDQVIQVCQGCGKAAMIVTKEEAATTVLYCVKCKPKEQDDGSRDSI